MENEKRDLFDEPELKEENVYLYDDEDDESFHTTDIDLDDTFFTAPLPPVSQTVTEGYAETQEEIPAAPEEVPAAPVEAAEDLPAKEVPEEASGAGETDAVPEEDLFEPDFDSALEEAFEPGFGSYGEGSYEPGFEPDFEATEESYDFYTAGEDEPDNVRPEKRSHKRRGTAVPEEAGQYDTEPEYAEEPSAPRRKSSFVPFLIIALLLLLAAAAIGSVIYIRRSNSQKEEAALEELAKSAVNDVSNGLYDEAMAKAEKLYYTSGYSNRIRMKWDEERADLIEYIEGERKRGEAGSGEQAIAEALPAEEAAAPEDPSLLSLDECIEMAKSELPFSNFDVIIQDKILYISFWQAGYGDQAVTARESRGEALAAWNSMQDDIRSYNNHMRIVLNENGHESYDLIYALLNDINTEYTLYEVMNGVVTYAAVR